MFGGSVAFQPAADHQLVKSLEPADAAGIENGDLGRMHGAGDRRIPSESYPTGLQLPDRHPTAWAKSSHRTAPVSTSITSTWSDGPADETPMTRLDRSPPGLDVMVSGTRRSHRMLSYGELESDRREAVFVVMVESSVNVAMREGL